MIVIVEACNSTQVTRPIVNYVYFKKKKSPNVLDFSRLLYIYKGQTKNPMRQERLKVTVERQTAENRVEQQRLCGCGSGVGQSRFYRQGLPSKPHKKCGKRWEAGHDARRPSPGETWRPRSEGGRVRGGKQCGCARGGGRTARRGGGVKGHSTAAGLAGGGRERTAPCARVEKRRYLRAGGRRPRPLRRLRPCSTFAASVSPSTLCSRRGGRLGLSGPS